MMPRRPAGGPWRRAGAVAALAAGAVVSAAAPAQAYVRYLTSETRAPFYWPQSCVMVTAYPEALTDLTPEQSMHAAQAAADSWSATGDSCTFLDVQVARQSGDAVARYDRRNNLIFRVASWCKSSDPAGTCSYDRDALAITSVFVNTKDGQIRDADIEVNAKYFVWTDVDIEPGATARGKQDLQNALTHEMGHLIGLDHSCFSAGGGAARPVDNLGNPVPDCADAPEAVRATTMFASATPGDTTKRTLAPDDQLAVCEMYPKASDPMICQAVGNTTDQGGCACAVGPAGPGRFVSWLPAAAGLGLLLARRRRRRR